MAERPIVVNFDDVPPDKGLEGFRSETDTSFDTRSIRLTPARDRRAGNASGVAVGARNSRYLRVKSTAFAAVFLIVAMGALLLLPSLKREHAAVTSRASEEAAESKPKQLANSGAARAEIVANDAELAAPASRTGESAITPPQTRSTASPATPSRMTSGARQTRSNASRPNQRRAAQPPAATSRRRQAAESNARSRAAAILPPQASAPAPTVAASRDVRASDEQRPPMTTESDQAQAVTASAQVIATTSIPDSADLAFRWSAPAGKFADPTARETTFVCPSTPQAVPVTVTVRNATGAEATNTVTVRCVASQN